MFIVCLVHQIEKQKQNCYDFLIYRIFRKLTIDFENRTKHQAETKSCVVVDVGHYAIIYKASSVLQSGDQ